MKVKVKKIGNWSNIRDYIKYQRQCIIDANRKSFQADMDYCDEFNAHQVTRSKLNDALDQLEKTRKKLDEAERGGTKITNLYIDADKARVRAEEEISALELELRDREERVAILEQRVRHLQNELAMKQADAILVAPSEDEHEITT